VTLFGRQIDAEFNTPILKRGIEIRTQSGDDIKAIHKGSVVYADWFKGYGKMLIINHGERYYSLYAHASEIFPKVGETISDGQVIGKIGDTGSIKGPILYFEIRYKGEPQDPLVWLRKK
jgi:septal ring factor EnvC (AmiA/AmiB activator)